MTEQQSDKYRDEPARIRDMGLRLAFLADILLEDNYIVESVDVRNAGALLERLAASVALPELQQRSPELIAALRARCPGNGGPDDADDDSVCECQSYEAHEQGAPCPPGCCVMAEEKDVRSILEAIEDEDAPLPERSTWNEAMEEAAKEMDRREQPHAAEAIRNLLTPKKAP